MSGEFSEKTRALNVFDNYCRKCKCNAMCSLHHILGRSVNHPDSPYNSIWLCYDCHAIADAYNQKNGKTLNRKQKELLRLQMQFLAQQGYEHTYKDTLFFKENDIDIIGLWKGIKEGVLGGKKSETIGLKIN